MGLGLSLASRSCPYLATLRARQRLSPAYSGKQTYHLSLAIDYDRLPYRPGDALAIWPQNAPAAVEELLAAGKFIGQEPVVLAKEDKVLSLHAALTTRCDLFRTSKALLRLLHQSLPLGSQQQQLLLARWQQQPAALLASTPQQLLAEYQPCLAAQDFAAALLPLRPRLYSIASSPLVQRQQLDLLVTVSTVSQPPQCRYGVASHFLCQQLQNGEQLATYLQPTRHFLLPAADRSLIMIAAGTGVAPFRAFLQQRQALQHSGRNWLFFGEWDQRHCFYRQQWQELADCGFLHLTTAFSRSEQLYVQDRLREYGDLLWEWLRQGAVIYVCGDAQKMAGAVWQAWRDIIQQHGGMTPARAAAYLQRLRRGQRYLQDVY